MKISKTVLTVLAIAATTAATTFAGNIGFVDMEQLIKLHPRTTTDRAILEKYVKEFEDERDDIVNEIKKESEELEKITQEAQDVTLSQKALDEKRALAKAKILKIRQLQQKARQMADERQKNLTSEEMRMRRRVVNDIQKIIASVAREKKLDLVLDNTSVGIGGYGTVLYNRETMDITNEIIKRLPKAEDDTGK